MELAEGVIVGCSKTIEWYLPWWYANYCLHNAYPITFFDFGDMTPKAKEWCQMRGNVVDVDIEGDFVAAKEEVNPQLADKWERMRRYVWEMRKFWFKKPIALLQSPYQKNLWLDLDCQTVGSIEPIFKEYLASSDFAIMPEDEITQEANRQWQLTVPGQLMYNSGVIAFKKGSPLIQEWGERARDQNHLFLGDQQLLSRIIFEKKYPIATLPYIYNWPAARDVNLQAVIVHYWGSAQELIYNQINFLKAQGMMDLSFFYGR